MDLERNHTFFHSFDTVVETTLSREETAEAIVPDACPDILRILETEGSVFLSEKNSYDGRGELCGEVRAAVLYLPDGEEPMRHLDVKLPFTCSVEHGGISGSACITAIPCLCSIDARALNPRKILVRAEISIAVCVRNPREMQLLSGLTCEEEAGVQQQVEQQRSFLTVCVEEKEVSFSDSLKLPTDCQELLKARVMPNCAEAKIIGNKLIFKGEVRLETLYRSSSGLENGKFELPFSQIMEVTNASEESVISMYITPADLTCEPEGDTRDHLSVSMNLSAQAVVEEERLQNVVRDVYSTAYQLTATADTLSMRTLTENGELPLALREVMETEASVRRVLDCHVAVGAVSCADENGQSTLVAPVTVYALCQDDQEELLPVTATFQAMCRVNQTVGGAMTADCAPTGEVYATPTAGGIEARVPLRFHYVSASVHNMAVVSDVSIDTEHPCTGENMPSLILRPVLQGERLWDVAKSYHTTVAELVKANDLTEEEALCGRMLLIPKRR